mmetsp:Transcript_15532/g.37240  ORF Transcript_15532/g.37240 Transcript_15532/m.37240 type:complete len:291 (+) Transcript_15532:4730-5602(+)
MAATATSSSSIEAAAAGDTASSIDRARFFLQPFGLPGDLPGDLLPPRPPPPLSRGGTTGDFTAATATWPRSTILSAAASALAGLGIPAGGRPAALHFLGQLSSCVFRVFSPVASSLRHFLQPAAAASARVTGLSCGVVRCRFDADEEVAGGQIGVPDNRFLGGRPGLPGDFLEGGRPGPLRLVGAAMGASSSSLRAAEEIGSAVAATSDWVGSAMAATSKPGASSGGDLRSAILISSSMSAGSSSSRRSTEGGDDDRVDDAALRTPLCLLVIAGSSFVVASGTACRDDAA